MATKEEAVGARRLKRELAEKLDRAESRERKGPTQRHVSAHHDDRLHYIRPPVRGKGTLRAMNFVRCFRVHIS
ncbi:MAG: hypothetical protein JRE18_07620 [Deltaproteobacteria bacterium]|nr:hypothetical protein [Deltaproteobacteria bacterium]